MKVAVIAYAIERGKGSEQGSGYNFCLELAQHTDLALTIVTRHNNAAPLREDPAFTGVTIRGYDPPRALTFWKRGGRNIIAYYYVWQLGLRRHLQRLQGREQFDVIHVYNFHTDWAPHFLAAVAPATVWGPICHQPKLPSEYFAGIPIARRIADRVRWTVKSAFWRLDPNLRRAAAMSDVILYANSDIAPPFAGLAHVRQQTFGGAAFIAGDDPSRQRTSADFTFLHVGRSVEIKGAHLALEAFSRYKRDGGTGHLLLVGEGELRELLEDRARTLNVQTCTRFVDWMAQSELASVYANADAFLYPSMGNQDTVVAEALAAGLPIVCVEGTGTATMSGDAAVTVPRIDGWIAAGLAVAMSTLERQSVSDLPAFERRRNAALTRAQSISWAATASSIRDIYAELSPS
ncbi:glycosyltransferase [Nocardioides sp.]|uniref:glycosyltransferase family 4 protein n=1 Tax=Nocardioides sp. TaxID=35761 RepID=UPI0031FF4430|nr:glycosyltransferase [Nocardioides sp.]